MDKANFKTSREVSAFEDRESAQGCYLEEKLAESEQGLHN